MGLCVKLPLNILAFSLFKFEIGYSYQLKVNFKQIKNKTATTGKLFLFRV